MDTPNLTFPKQPTPPDLTRWGCMSCSVSAPNLLVLPSCGHMFCTPCVDQWLWTYISVHGGQSRRYPCQQCHTSYQIPPEGLDAFVQNVHVLRLELELQNLTMAATNATTPNTSCSMESEDTSRTAESQDANIMEDTKAACSGEYASVESYHYALLPYTSYCRLPHHMY